MTGSAIFFAVEYLPGQYDQRADSAAQCIKLMNSAADATVRFARVIILEGSLTKQQAEAVKSYCINPVDSQLASAEKPENLEMETTVPEDVAVITGFAGYTPEELEKYRKDMGFAMSPEDIKFVQEYYRDDEQRDPTLTELKVIDTYWSDHCRHTTFNTTLEEYRLRGKSLRAHSSAQAFAQIYGHAAAMFTETGTRTSASWTWHA